MLAVLAESAVPEDYGIRVGQWRGTVADLVVSEKRTCVPGIDLSQKLIGLAHYLPDAATWKNSGGQAWSLKRMVREELSRSPPTYGPEVTRQLMGLAYAVQRRARSGHPCDGQYKRAQRFLAEYEDYAMSLQNPGGSWHPDFFAAKGRSNDRWGMLRATGHIVEWLALALPDGRLHDPRITSSVGYLAGALEGLSGRLNVAAASTQEIDAVMHAVHALRIYDRRVFRPADPQSNSTP
jgi:hypothetical protein